MLSGYSRPAISMRMFSIISVRVEKCRNQFHSKALERLESRGLGCLDLLMIGVNMMKMNSHFHRQFVKAALCLEMAIILKAMFPSPVLLSVATKPLHGPLCCVPCLCRGTLVSGPFPKIEHARSGARKQKPWSQPDRGVGQSLCCWRQNLLACSVLLA